MDKGFRVKIITAWICIAFFVLGTIVCMIFQEPLLDIAREAMISPYQRHDARGVQLFTAKAGAGIAIPFYMILCTIGEIIFAAALTNVCSHEEKWTNWSTAKKLLIARILMVALESACCYIYMGVSMFVFGTFFHPLMDMVVSVVTMPTWTIMATMFLILVIQIMIRAGIHRKKVEVVSADEWHV